MNCTTIAKAPAEMTRVAILGGSRDGFRANGFDYIVIDMSGNTLSFEDFSDGVSSVIKDQPYVVYNKDSDLIWAVSDYADVSVDHELGDRVKRMVRPDEETLRQWYDEECAILAQ